MTTGNKATNPFHTEPNLSAKHNKLEETKV